MEEKELAVVTSIDGCMDFLESLEQIREQLLHFTSDSTVNIDALKARLVWLGYERVGQVEMPGQFSIRGGIVDIYCLTEENPWRIELWGDEIDSIRSFDAESQRSLENLEEITIYPAVEHPKKDRLWRRNIARAVCTEQKRERKIFRKTGFVLLKRYRRS